MTQTRQKQEKQAATEDLQSIIKPLIVQILGAGLAFGAYLIAGHALGIQH